MEKTSERNWSSLPSDLVSLIKSFLLGRDRAIFNCVCKAWKSVPTAALPSPGTSPIRLIDPSNTLSKIIQFPLLMFIGRDDSVCHFYHAIHNTTYALDVPEIANAAICYSKDGWLLMGRPGQEFFFFNPLTKEQIDLPLEGWTIPCRGGMAFSSIPTSPDCVVLAIDDKTRDRSLSLAYIRMDEDSWTYHELTLRKVDFVPSSCNPIYHKGIFYCLGGGGNLVKFDPNEEDESAWSVLARPNKPGNSNRRHYLIECEGELLSVFEGPAGEFIKIFKLDERSMSWKKVRRVGNHTLFVSLASSFSVASKEAQALGLRNTIFFPRFRDRQHSVFYSQATSKFHSLTLDDSSKNFFGTTEKLHCCWIQPNFDRHSEDELEWDSE